jgi:hypothetical protein
MMTVAERLETVRNAVATATTGITGQDYRDFMEQLLSDAEGWRMELEEMAGEDSSTS